MRLDSLHSSSLTLCLSELILLKFAVGAMCLLVQVQLSSRVLDLSIYQADVRDSDFCILIQCD